MLYSLLAPLASDYGFLNVIRYITFRCLAAALLALLISFLFGPRLIRVLRAAMRRLRCRVRLSRLWRFRLRRRRRADRHHLDGDSHWRVMFTR